MANGPIQLFPGIIPAAGRLSPGPMAPQQGGPGFNQAVTGLLGNPALATGIGLLAGAFDRQPVGQTLAQGLQFGQGTAALSQRNELLRQRMRQEAAQAQALQRQQAAVGELSGLLSSGEDVTPETLLPSLLQVAPGAVAQGLLAQVFPEPGQARGLEARFQALEERGVEVTPELAVELAGGAEDPIEKLLAVTAAQQARLNTQISEERLAAARQERTAAEEARVQSERDDRRAFIDTSRSIGEIAGLVTTLEGTPLQPGTGGEDIARGFAGAQSLVSRLAGFPAEDAERLATAHDRLQQLTTRESIEATFGRLREAGTITDRKFNALTSTIVDPSSTPDAMRLALGDLTQASIRQGRDLGEDTSALEELLLQLRGEGQSAVGGGAGGGVDFNFDLGTGQLSPAR